MSWSELDIIKSLAAGILRGATEFNGMWFAVLKLTPVGVRWNPDGPYYEFRDPAIWLSPDMMARVIGLPLLGGMSDGEIDSAEFARRMVGLICHAFASDDALMAVCRICNDNALKVKPTTLISVLLPPLTLARFPNLRTVARRPEEKRGRGILIC